MSRRKQKELKRQMQVAVMARPKQTVTVASLSRYDAANSDKTRTLSNRIGTNPDSVYSQMERVMLGWQAEDVVKNSDWAIFCYFLRQYCTPICFQSEYPDEKLAQEINDYVKRAVENGGVNQSALDAFSAVAHVGMPVYGDGLLAIDQDEMGLKFIVYWGDQIGKLYQFTNGEPNYFAGIYRAPNGSNEAFELYDRGIYQEYVNRHVLSAFSCIYMQDNLFPAIRGVSKFAQALQGVQKRNKTWQFGLDAMAAQSKIIAVESNNSGGPTDWHYEETDADGKITMTQTLPNGAAVKYITNGDSYQFMKGEQPSQSLLQGLDYADERTCISFGFPKAALITARDGGGAPVRYDMSRCSGEIIRIRNKQKFALKRMADAIIMDGIRRRILPPKPGMLAGSWLYGPLPTADAFRDSKSDLMDIRAGLNTRGGVLAERGMPDFKTMLKKSTSEAVAIQMAVQDGNKELTAKGYEPTLTPANIMQDSENQQPMQPVDPNAEKEPKKEPPKTE